MHAITATREVKYEAQEGYMKRVLPPRHFSASSLKAYRECGKRFQLQRIVDEPETPSWWLVSGTAFHAATEHIDKEMPRWNDRKASALVLAEITTESFNDAVMECMEQEPDMNKWATASRKAVKPSGDETYRQQYDRVSEWLRGYLAWRSQHRDVEVLMVEEALFEPVEGSPVPLKGYVDRVYAKKGQPFVVDLKSGSTVVKDPMQLVCYAVGLKKKHGLDARYGYYYQSKKNDLGDRFDLSRWPESLVGQYAKKWCEGIERGEFFPSQGEQCFMCSMKSYCYVYSGDTEKTRQDPLNPNYGVAINE